MRSFWQYMNEVEAGGSAPGKLELAKLDLKVARAYAEKKFAENGFDLDEELPDFDKNFSIAKVKAMMGRTQRKDMPVVSNKIPLLQNFLKKGSIDLNKPFSSDEASKDPFPLGLSGEDAKFFLVRGLRIYDGSKVDDIVNFRKESVEVQKLIPIQKQIYFDKSIDKQSKEGRKRSMHYMKQTSTFVASSDHKIIDGHHRFLSSLLIDPQMKVKVLVIELPMDKLLPLTLAFSDAIGNKRNH